MSQFRNGDLVSLGARSLDRSLDLVRSFDGDRDSWWFQAGGARKELLLFLVVLALLRVEQVIVSKKIWGIRKTWKGVNFRKLISQEVRSFFS